MAAPGLFPEGDAKASRFASFVPIVLVIALLALGIVHAIWANITIRELEVELAAARTDLGRLQRQAMRTPQLMAELNLLQEAIARLSEDRPSAPAAAETPPEPAPPAPPPPPPPNPPGRFAEGLKAFRQGRYAEAQVHFFRSLPDGYVPLALASLARGEVEDALHWLTKAMEADAEWLDRIAPSELFGSEEEFTRLLESMEARVRDNPLDHSAKLLLAYLHHETKGAPFAKALLIEITNAEPGHAGARRFLETLEK